MAEEDDGVAAKPTRTPAAKKAAAKPPARKRPAKKASSKKASAKRPARKSPREKGESEGSDAAPRSKCFVISPFGGWFDTYFEEIFSPAVESAEMDVCRADDMYRPTSIVHDIWTYVKNAEIIVADLTGKNPNVMYELGLAHALGKPVVMVTQDLDDVPFDLRSMRVTTYTTEDPTWAESLRNKIKVAIEEVASAPSTAVLQPFGRPEPDISSPDPDLSAEVRTLERRVNIIQSQLAETPRTISSRREYLLRPDEARKLIKDLLAEGVNDDLLIEMVAVTGPPKSWVRREIARQRDEEGAEAEDS